VLRLYTIHCVRPKPVCIIRAKVVKCTRYFSKNVVIFVVKKMINLRYENVSFKLTVKCYNVIVQLLFVYDYVTSTNIKLIPITYLSKILNRIYTLYIKSRLWGA